MAVDPEKVRQKLQHIRTQLGALERFRNMQASDFSADPYHVAAATRMTQVALEAMLDLCAHIIAHEGWGLPRSYREVVLVAVEHELIPRELQDGYLAMAAFRNRIVHLYDRVEDAEVLAFIQDHLDALRPLVAAVVRRYLPVPVARFPAPTTSGIRSAG